MDCGHSPSHPCSLRVFTTAPPAPVPSGSSPQPLPLLLPQGLYHGPVLLIQLSLLLVLKGGLLRLLAVIHLPQQNDSICEVNQHSMNQALPCPPFVSGVLGCPVCFMLLNGLSGHEETVISKNMERRCMVVHTCNLALGSLRQVDPKVQGYMGSLRLAWAT